MASSKDNLARTPWNPKLFETIFWIQLVLSLLVLAFGTAASFDWAFLTGITICPIAFVELVNSATHLGVIRHKRPINLGAIVGVNVLWAAAWAAMFWFCVAIGIALGPGTGYDGFKSFYRWGTPITAICYVFTFFAMTLSILICVLSIRALRRQKKGLVAVSDEPTGPKKLGIPMQRYEPGGDIELAKFTKLPA